MNRRLVAALAAALFVTLLPGGPSVPRSVGAGPAGDNVLRVSINGDVTMNPLTFPQQLPTTQVIKVVFNTLTKSATLCFQNKLSQVKVLEQGVGQRVETNEEEAAFLEQKKQKMESNQ